MTIFRTVASVTACTSCGQVIDGTGWRPKTSHVCARPGRTARVEYVAALAYADALARLNARTTTTEQESS